MFLSEKQVNELKVGTSLALELEAEKGKRKFVHVNSYLKDTEGRHRSVNGQRLDDDFILNYGIMIYSVPSEVIENDWDAGESIKYHYKASDIKSISELEKELKLFINDFSLLKPAWYCDDVL